MKTVRLLIAAVAVGALLLGRSSLSAQNIEPARYEFELASTKQNVHALPIDEQGVILFFEHIAADSARQSRWNFLLIDTSLRDRQNVSFRFDSRYSLTTSVKSGSDAVFVLNNRQKDDSSSVQIVDFDRNKSEFMAQRIKLPNGGKATSAAVLDNSLLLSVSEGEQGYSLLVDLRQWRVKRIDFDVEKDYSVFKTDVAGDRFVVALKLFEKRKFEKTLFISIDTSGNIIGRNELENKNNSSMGRFCFATDSAGHLIVLATIETETNKKVEMKEVNVEQERSTYGVCFAKYADTATIRNFAFAKLPRTFATRNQDVVQYKSKEDNRKSNTPNYQLLSPKLVTFDSTLVFVGEAYAYEYRPETHIAYDFYGRSYPYTYYVFEGYSFFTTFVVAFNSDGDIGWNANLNFSEPITMSLESNVSGAAIDSTLIFASALKNEVRYKAFGPDGHTTIASESTDADFFYANDELSDEPSSFVEQWFGNSFIMYGQQTIDNGRLVGKNKRNVFFVQRLDFK